MSASPFKKIYSAFIDEKRCVEVLGQHAVAPDTQVTPPFPIYEYSMLKRQEMEYMAAISPRKTPREDQILTSWDVEYYRSGVRFAQVREPTPTPPLATPPRTRRYRPYTPSKAATPLVISPRAGLVGGMSPAWDPDSYWNCNGFDSPSRLPGPSTERSAGRVPPSSPPHPRARESGGDDMLRELAAPASSPPRLFVPSPFYGVSTSTSQAASVTPPGAAADEVEGDEEEPQPDVAAVPNHANVVTNQVHSQQGAASRVATTVGSVVRPFPANREELLDLLQEGMHVHCILPSERLAQDHIICRGRHKLQENGDFLQGDECDHKPFESECSYARHIKVKHLEMARRSLGITEFVHGTRPGALVRKPNSKLVVVGARAKDAWTRGPRTRQPARKGNNMA